MAETSIEWTRGDDGTPGAVWNPTTGCDRISAGCDHCYALTLAKRLKAMGAEKYQTDGDPRTSGPGFGVAVHPSALDAPLRWRKPRRVFVNSMSDLFHDRVPDEFIARVFAVMAATPRHTYQVLTKRHARMRSLVSSDAFRVSVQRRVPHVDAGVYAARHFKAWPLPNVWLGASIEDQRWAGIRVPALVGTPAAVRFLSCEPLLGPLDLGAWLCGEVRSSTAVHGAGGMLLTSGPGPIRWVIAGGESGSGFRPLDLDWVRSIRDQCAVSGVAFFFKQVGGRTPKAGGRLLDGRTWDQMPTAGVSR